MKKDIQFSVTRTDSRKAIFSLDNKIIKKRTIFSQWAIPELDLLRRKYSIGCNIIHDQSSLVEILWNLTFFSPCKLWLYLDSQRRRWILFLSRIIVYNDLALLHSLTIFLDFLELSIWMRYYYISETSNLDNNPIFSRLSDWTNPLGRLIHKWYLFFRNLSEDSISSLIGLFNYWLLPWMRCVFFFLFCISNLNTNG